ncbi:MAG TPA: hypothetical protein VGF58_00725 [Burkholderiales bacterium]
MTAADDIAGARRLFEKAEREADPELKAHALEEALALLASIDPDEASEAERRLVANLRLAHARRLLGQLVGLASVSMDAWFEYVGVLLGDLGAEVERLTQADAELKRNYDRFLELRGADVAKILRKHPT